MTVPFPVDKRYKIKDGSLISMRKTGKLFPTGKTIANIEEEDLTDLLGIYYGGAVVTSGSFKIDIVTEEKS